MLKVSRLMYFAVSFPFAMQAKRNANRPRVKTKAPTLSTVLQIVVA